MGEYLGKWPEMVVTGDPVTREQANEILIRTMHRNYWNSCNDREWTAAINEVLGFKDVYASKTFEARMDVWGENSDLMDSLGVLELEYIYNSRIASAYIFGPHGWMNWDGTITGNPSYNVGKWPEETELIEEWERVAEAFPYLNLEIQFFTDPGWTGEDEVEPAPLALVLKVKDGAVTVVEDWSTVFASVPVTPSSITIPGLFTSGRERGVTLERFQEAVEQVRRT